MEEIKLGTFTKEHLKDLEEQAEEVDSAEIINTPILNQKGTKMVTFMQKEGLAELASGIAATISRVSITHECFSKNTDVKKSIELEREIWATSYDDLDYEQTKKKINDLEWPYAKIEEALGGLAQKNITFSFDTNTKEFPNEPECEIIKEAISELNKRNIYIACNNDVALEFFRDLAEINNKAGLKI